MGQENSEERGTEGKLERVRKYAFCTIFIAYMSIFAFGAQPATVLIDPPVQQSPPVGGEITVDVKVEDITGLFAYQFDLVFDNTALQFSSIEEGEFLRADGASTIAFIMLGGQMIRFHDITPDMAADVNLAGMLMIANTRFGTNVNVDGTGRLITITFEVLEAKESALELQDMVMCDSDAQIIDVDIASGLITASGGDDIPPTAVTDLSAFSSAVGNTVELNWTAPGDDGSTGAAKEYIFKCNTVPIMESNWHESSDIDGEPEPGAAGSAESMMAKVPYPGVLYYFAMKTQDEAPNTSGISNSPCGKAVSVYLYAGWNLVSFVAPTAMLVEDAIEAISESCTSVWRYDAFTARWLRFIVGEHSFLSNLGDMEPGYGYWIHVTSDCTWDFGGSGALPSSALEIDLYSERNLVALTSSAAMSIADAISRMSGDCTSVWSYDASSATWLRYILDGSPVLNNLDEIGSGYGYCIYVTSDCTWDMSDTGQ